MPQQKTLVFLGSKPIGAACLLHLIAAAPSLNVKIIAVLTQARKEFGGEEDDIAAIAARHGILLIDRLEDMPACDILYSVQYHIILKAADIAKAGLLAVNLHMAPLPEYRGCNQFSFALIDGKKEFGTTLHVMDPRIDHGDILAQKRFAIPENCWVHELYMLTEHASLELFKETLNDVVNGSLEGISQERMVAQYGTSLHYRNEMAGLKNISLDWDAEKISRYIRATSMPGFEPPFAMLGDKKIYFQLA